MYDEKNLSIKVNPTSNTAVTTLILLANAHYEKALEILEQMGVKKGRDIPWCGPVRYGKPADRYRQGASICRP